MTEKPPIEVPYFNVIEEVVNRHMELVTSDLPLSSLR